MTGYRKIGLNGNWDLGVGEHPPEKFPYTVPVPGLVDLASPPLPWEKYQWFWYRKIVDLPQNLDRNQVYLQLEQVKYGTKIYINGKHIGGDIPCYTGQEFCITPAIRAGARNEILIRVGRKENLPSHSAVGNDYEKSTFFPGIWGDAWLHIFGGGRLQWMQILPDIHTGSVRVKSKIESFPHSQGNLVIHYRILDGSSAGRDKVSPLREETFSTDLGKSRIFTRDIPLDSFTLWSPEQPHLYRLEYSVSENGISSHTDSLRFGMREFTIRNGHFSLNGNRKVLLGGNIAFHRMLSDPSRTDQPWREEWIRKVLGEIPRLHNMTFFRMHLGHAYNRWYDIADEEGILLQNEWLFWNSTGSEQQIEREFTSWIRENGHHPCIVIWDPLNESEDPRITQEIIPRLKNVDPSRPWEHVDFREDHPYIYSLGEVYNIREFGHTRPLAELRDSPSPTMVNEYGWWWLDWNERPSELTRDVVNRWLGPDPTTQEIIAHQSFLFTELTELFRRLDLDGIMPFVYLSAGTGPTGNFFSGSLDALQPKPVLAALKRALSPVGLSIDLLDRHFVPGEVRQIPVHLFNDTNNRQSVHLDCYFSGRNDDFRYQKDLELPPNTHSTHPVTWKFPDESGELTVKATLLDNMGNDITYSEKPGFIIPRPQKRLNRELPSFLLLDHTGYLTEYFDSAGIKYELPAQGRLNGDYSLILSYGDGINDLQTAEIGKFLSNGGVVILQEPEYGIREQSTLRLAENLSIDIQWRKDPDRGGYDSYVFPVDPAHPLWKEIPGKHLQIWNGGCGGEIVSQHLVHPSLPHRILAACNLHLRIPAVMEVPCGDGLIVISRLQVRGRLSDNSKSRGATSPRRFDPVAEVYLWNLLTCYADNQDYKSSAGIIQRERSIHISRARAKDGLVFDIVGTTLHARWGILLDPDEKHWVQIDLAWPVKIRTLQLDWKRSYRKSLRIELMEDEEGWNEIAAVSGHVQKTNSYPIACKRTTALRICYQNRDSVSGHTLWKINLLE